MKFIKFDNVDKEIENMIHTSINYQLLRYDGKKLPIYIAESAKQDFMDIMDWSEEDFFLSTMRVNGFGEQEEDRKLQATTQIESGVCAPFSCQKCQQAEEIVFKAHRGKNLTEDVFDATCYLQGHIKELHAEIERLREELAKEKAVSADLRNALGIKQSTNIRFANNGGEE